MIFLDEETIRWTGVIIVVLLELLLAWLVIDIRYHASRTKHSCDSYGYGSFKQFLQEVHKIDDWYRPYSVPYVWFSQSCKSEINDDIIKFNGKGFVFRSLIDYARFRIWLYKNRRKLSEKNTVNWNKP